MINMESPDPSGLFDQFQWQRQQPPENSSVTAQISNRPVVPVTTPPVSLVTTPPAQTEAPPPANPFVALYESGVMDKSVQQEKQSHQEDANPFVSLYESGVMEKSVNQAQQENPFKQLYDSGVMTSSVLQTEDQAYDQALKDWENQDVEPLTGMQNSNFFPSPTAGALPKPEAPARDLKQIETDWQMGVQNLRGQELGNILGQIEGGNLTPEQEATVTRLIEPALTPDLKKQLQISRLTRDKYQEMKSEFEQQMAEQEGLKETLGPEARRQLTTPEAMEMFRGVGRGLSFGYAFAPDEDRLNSDNPDEVADERAKRQFYNQQKADNPVSAFTGELLGAALPIGLATLPLRAARVANASRALKAGPPTAQTASVIARSGAPATVSGNVVEGALASLPYDALSRIPGQEDMSDEELKQARLQQIVYGAALGAAGDAGLSALARAASGTTRAIKEAPGKVQATLVNRKLDKLAKDKGFDNTDQMIEETFLKTVTDETGERIQLQKEIIDVLPNPDQETKANVTSTDAPSTDSAGATSASGRTQPDTAQPREPVPGRTAVTEETPGQTVSAPERPASSEAEAVVPGRSESSVIEEVVSEAPSEQKVTGKTIVEAPIDELSLSSDVPQFKEGADQQGVVEPLGGSFDRVGVGPIQVWVRSDGSKEVISGRHRLDLAQRSGEETIPAQYHYESEGFGRDQAAALDAMLNIREGQGKVKDYVDFFKATGHTQEEANAQGILARATGRRAFTVATDGSDALITAHRNNQLTDEAATRIATAAPGSEKLQAVGIKAIQDGKTITVAENMVKAVRTMTDDTAMKSGDMFGFDDSALKEAENLARKAAAKQAEIQKTLSAVQGAARRPELAAREGVDVKDPEAVKRRIAELKQQKQDWQNWHTNPELTAELRGDAITPTARTEAEAPAREQEGFDLTSQTETELTAKAKASQEAEAAQLKQQQDLEAKAKADIEAKDFELGLQGSGRDVSAKQNDMLGLGSKEQLNTQPGLKSEAKTTPKDQAKKAESTPDQTRAQSPQTETPGETPSLKSKAQTTSDEAITAEATQQKQTDMPVTETSRPVSDDAIEMEPITEGVHTKTGKPIYNIKVTTKLGKEKFQEAAKLAREQGGNYYRGQFWQPTREKAEQFVNWLNGQTIDRTPRKMKAETQTANKAADKLRAQADKLQATGERELNQDRLTNTAKRLDQATTARNKASKKISLANTLRNIANGIEDGSVQMLSKLNSQTQLEVLESLKRRSIPASMIDDHYNGYSMSRQVKEGVTLEDYIDKVVIPPVHLHRDHARKLIEAMKNKRGFSRTRNQLQARISRTDRGISLTPHSEEVVKIDEFIKKYEADAGWQFKESTDQVKRLQRMGITTDEQLRSALRELETVKGSDSGKTRTEHKLDGMRLKIKQSARSFNDFFPTPEKTTNRVLELADVRPGMKTLEPNAGMGHIAEKLQTAAGKDNVDLVEMSGQLVNYLETSGHKVTQADFLKYGDKDTYDRIVMNPPFSKDQDIEHVMHAYDLLKPGGKMTAIMSNMAGLRSNQKNRAFSEWMDEVGAHVEDLEAGSFKSSFNPTSVSTKVLVVDKPLQPKTTVKAERSGIEPEVRAAFEESQARFEETLRKRRAEPEKVNPRYQAYLDSLEDPATANNADFMAFTRKLANEYKQVRGAMPDLRGSKEWDEWHEGLDAYIKESVGNSRKTDVPPGTTLYSSPVIPAARQVADMLHLNPAGSFGGGIYGGIAAGDESEAERYSAQWWLDSAFGALAGAVAGAAGATALKKVPIKGRTITGEQGWGKQAYDFMGRQITRLPGMSRGDKDVLAMGKQQRLMKTLIERQAEQAGEYLLKNFTPAERATMADLIEQRGIIAEGNLLHRQAKELDDFIAYTSKKLQELGMLDDTIEPGGYLHRYYSKHLGITGLARSMTPKGKALSGTWSIRRGTQEVFDSRYMSQSMRGTLEQVQSLKDEYDALKRQAGDLIDSDTQTRLDDIKAQMNELQSIEFREYLAPENGTLKSFYLAADEVPLIPGLKNRPETTLPEPARQSSLEGIEDPPKVGTTGELVLTDRRWTIDGMKEDGSGILHRDWTKAERESWGEINDAAYRMVRGQAEVAHDLSLGTFFKQVHDRFEGTKVSDTEIEGWHKVPNAKVGKGSRMNKYGALSGKYVTEDVWKAIRNHGRNPMLNFFNNNPAVATYLKGLNKWKAYKTVYNPVSHVNNSVSNLQMYYLSDYETKYLAQAVKELRKGEASDFVREADNSGLFGNDWTSEITGKAGQKNIDELLENLRTQSDIPDFEQSLDSVMGLKQWFIESSDSVRGAQGPWKTGAEMAKAIGNPLINTAKKPINKAANAMQKAYRMEDEFFKMAVYLAERQKGTKPSEAVQAANQYFFDYNDMPDAVKWARDFPIGSPFISYTYFAVPAIVRTAVEKPEKILALAAALEGINYASMTLNDELQDQGYWDRMADENELYPGWMQGRSIWGGVNNVSIPFLESYKLGLANANVVGNPLVGQVERSEGWPSFLGFWGSGWQGSNPITTLINDITNNQDWRGNPIWSPGAPTSEQVRKGVNYVYQNLAPSNPVFPASYHQQKIFEGLANQVRTAEEEDEQPNRVVGGVVDLANAVSEALGGSQFTGLDRSENEILTRDALAGSVGFKLRPVRVDQFTDSKYWELSQEVEDKRRWIRGRERLYGENRLTDDQINEDREEADDWFSQFEKKEARLEEAITSQAR